MRMEVTDDEVTVYVSRRNLLTLLHKFEMTDSERTLSRRPHDGGSRSLILIADDDDAHYGDRVPGAVHPQTEEAIHER